jgi:predicted transcriptional regulator
MTDGTPADRPEMQYVAAIAAAYLSNNHMPTADLPSLIKSVHGALLGLASGSSVETANLKPAVSIKKSVTPDYIVCLEDGKHLKMLKRYLRSRYKLTPDEYRAKWNLPRDYPFTHDLATIGRLQTISEPFRPAALSRGDFLWSLWSVIKPREAVSDL